MKLICLSIILLSCTTNAHATSIHADKTERVGIHLQPSVVYNKQVLAKAGHNTTPSDWEAFIVYAERLEVSGIIPIALSDEFDQSGALKKKLLESFDILVTLRKYADTDHIGRSWTDTIRLEIDGKAAAVFMGDLARSEIAYFGNDKLEDFECSGLPSLQWEKHHLSFVASVLSPESQSDYLHYKGELPVIQAIDPKTLTKIRADPAMTAEEASNLVYDNLQAKNGS